MQKSPRGPFPDALEKGAPLLIIRGQVGGMGKGGRPGTPIGPILVSGYLLPKDRYPPDIRE